MAGTRPAYSAAPVYANTRESSSSLLKLALFFAALATLLSPYVEWRPAEVFVTTSDILFMIAAALLMCSGHVQTRPFGPTTLYWLSAYVIMILGLFIGRSEEHTSELQSLLRTSYAVFCLKKQKDQK